MSRSMNPRIFNPNQSGKFAHSLWGPILNSVSDSPSWAVRIMIQRGVSCSTIQKRYPQTHLHDGQDLCSGLIENVESRHVRCQNPFPTFSGDVHLAIVCKEAVMGKNYTVLLFFFQHMKTWAMWQPLVMQFTMWLAST